MKWFVKGWLGWMTWKKKVSSTLLQLTFDITRSIQKQEQILDWMESKRRALGMRLQRDDGILREKWMDGRNEGREEVVSLHFFYIRFEYRTNFNISSSEQIQLLSFHKKKSSWFQTVLKIHFVAEKNGHHFFPSFKKLYRQSSKNEKFCSNDTRYRFEINQVFFEKFYKYLQLTNAFQC